MKVSECVDGISSVHRLEVEELVNGAHLVDPLLVYEAPDGAHGQTSINNLGVGICGEFLRGLGEA